MEKIKKKLLVSFSGGETSGYMAQWLWSNKKDEFDMIFVFANTGQENEETLQFVEKCSISFGFPVVWVEAKVIDENRKGTEFNLVDFYSADRDGKPFESVIKKYGIPNASFKHCSRELKAAPIHKYAKSVWGKENYYTAIGIRSDEFDRVDKNWKSKRFIYPLIDSEYRPMTKKKINFWWSQQQFRLQLKGYQGNCITCWKKSDPKLYMIAKENERSFNFFAKMELRYGRFTPESRLNLMLQRGELVKYPITFFRRNRSALDILSEAKEWSGSVIDDSLTNDESCEIHASDCE